MKELKRFVTTEWIAAYKDPKHNKPVSNKIHAEVIGEKSEQAV